MAAARQVADGVVLLGAGRVPRSATPMLRLPDVPGVGGPLAGIRSALRWRPDACWLFLACDTPLVTPAALQWLREQARPGIWAVQPRLMADGPVQPLPGWYDGRSAALLESARGPSGLADHPKTASPVVPAALLPAWWNCNTPADCKRLAATR
jgi:molybdopterin-guanine dinucleotide biosynthesis protein A